MEFWGDDRGQSVQIGAILLFGILIIGLATMQATVIPEQNAETEFDHSQSVQADMQDLRNGLLRSSASGTVQPTRVTLGTGYQNRLLFINPPPATGRLRTVDEVDNRSMNITLETASGGVNLTGSEYENAREYWADAESSGEFNTTHVVYTSDYNEYAGEPTTIADNTLLYNTFGDAPTPANRTITGQTLVRGGTIDLLTLRGSLDESGTGTVTIPVVPVSESSRTIGVKSEENDPLFLNFTSRLPGSVWNRTDLLGGQPSVVNVTSSPVAETGYHRISVEFETGRSYRLRSSAVGVGGVSESESTTAAAYLVVVDGYNTVGEGETGELTVEVRDRFNNPVAGEEVNVNTDGTFVQVGSGSSSVNVETNSEGRATVEYVESEVTGEGETGWLEVGIGDTAYEYRNFTGLKVPEFAFGGSGGNNDAGINPNASGEIILTESNPNGNDESVLTFNNTGEEVSLVGARVDFYYEGGQGNSGSNAVQLYQGSGTDGTLLANLPFGGPYVDISPVTIAEGENEFTLSTDGKFQNDFLVITFVYEDDGTEFRTRYFVDPS